jgi:hypothetical protein
MYICSQYFQSRYVVQKDVVEYRQDSKRAGDRQCGMDVNRGAVESCLKRYSDPEFQTTTTIELSTHLSTTSLPFPCPSTKLKPSSSWSQNPKPIPTLRDAPPEAHLDLDNRVSEPATHLCVTSSHIVPKPLRRHRTLPSVALAGGMREPHLVVYCPRPAVGCPAKMGRGTSLGL